MVEAVVGDGKESASSSSGHAVLERGACVGRYVVIDRVGEGGMGVVYKAYDPELERQVALKFLRAKGDDDGTTTGGNRARLLREAKALARLSHPNVLAVFDVGVVGSDVYLATEFVEGATLGDWLQSAKRARRDVLRVFVAAGEGLAAAHRANLVHRDFKPANVMIGNDGRPRVLDFGVARLEVTTDADLLNAGDLVTEPRPLERGESLVATATSSTLTSTLSVDGELVGTPRYMAPEQHLGEPATAKADQFAYAIALYEALYGEPPFDGTAHAYIEHLVLGEVRPAPAGSDVPRHLRQVLLRALAPEPEARHPSMEALLRELTYDPAVRRRRWLLGGAALAITSALAITGYVAQKSRFGVCRGAEARLDGVWDAPRRHAVDEAFAKTGAPYAAEASRAVVRALDAYAAAWVHDRTDACEATRVRGEQSEELLDLRMQCFDERLTDLRERADLFAAADAATVEKAAESARRLAPLAACNDAAALRAPVRLPPAPDARDRAEASRAHVARGLALADAMRLPDAVAETTAAVDGGRALGYAPVLAEALRARALVEERSGHYDASAATYRDAIAQAEAGHHDELAARAWGELLHVIGERLAHYDEARSLLWVARAKLARVPEPSDMAPALVAVEATLDWRKRDYAAAEPHARAAVAGFEAVHGARAPEVGKALGLLGLVLEGRGRLDEAEACHSRSLAIMEENFGATHPSTVTALSHLADLRGTRGDHRAAVAAYERILEIDSRSMGPAHPVVAKIHNNLGDELLASGAVDDAIAHYRAALAIWEPALGPVHPDVATGLHNLATALFAKGDAAAALLIYQRCLAVRSETAGASSPLVVGDLLDVGAALRATGHADEAQRLEARALDADAKLTADGDYELRTKVLLGEAQLAQGKGAAALKTLEPAVNDAATAAADPTALARGRFALARAVASTGGDRARARALAEEARNAMRTLTPPLASEAHAIDAWLAKR